MPDKKPIIGIIIDADFIHHRTFGGASGLILSLIDNLNLPVQIMGIGYEGTIPWHCYQLNPSASFQAVDRLACPSRIPLRLKCLLSFWRQRWRILHSGVDLLYIHSPEIALPFLFGKGRLPVIFHQHGSENPVKWSKYAWARLPLFKRIYDLIMYVVHKKSTWTIVIDRPSLEQVQRLGMGHRASLLMNAIDLARFQPDEELRRAARRKFEVNDDECVLLFVGRLEEVKRVDRAVAGLGYLNARNPGQYRLFIAGDGTLRADLEETIRSQNLTEQVTFLGQVSHQHLPEYYNLADVLILPSEMEGTPMVILEALACGTPVIASRVGGIPDLIIEGKNGMTLQDLNASSLAQAIERVCEKRYLRSEVAATVQDLSASRFAERLLAITARILAERSRR
jgi:glycosyltransferase involved in cell wall biosynthesis